MRIDFLGLQAFVAIAERGGFQRAAGHLNLSQTALSHRMKKLETDLGASLLARTTRRIVLTPAGLALLPKAQRILAELEASLDSVRAQAGARGASVAIGCLPTLAMHSLPRILRLFQVAHPGVAVRVHDNSAQEIADLVQAGTIDFGVTIAAANRWDLETRPLLKEPFVLVCPATHPLAGRASVAWSELAGVPLVRVSPQTGNRILIDDALGARRDTLDWRFECQHVATALSLVGEGLGLAVVPRLAIGAGFAAPRLRSPKVTRTLAIVTKRGLPLSQAAIDLKTLVETHIGERPRKPRMT